MLHSRRTFLAGLVSLAHGVLMRGPARAAEGLRFGDPQPFDPASLPAMARALAAEPFAASIEPLPPALAELDYDQHRDIRFRPDQALWADRDLDVAAQFFHLGYRFEDPVHIFEVADGVAREVLYTSASFDYGKNELTPDFPEDLGFAGFRLHAPLNTRAYFDELAVFLGASYFRALGRGQVYGLSARAIAIDTGLPRPEEFPVFRRFWLERPEPRSDRIVLHALLEGPSVAGAYTFVLRPGTITTVDVTAHLYPRQPIGLLGISPLTSMFLFGPSDRRGVDDFRPRVHDSEGLQIWAGDGEWIWRPLVNPERGQLSIFEGDSPRGFGLLQRTRGFDAYQDLEARYDRRPSLWVEPLEAFGPGHVRLIELWAPEEIHDNIVAFWVPEVPIEPGTEQRFAYRLHWGLKAPVEPPLARCVATRVGLGGVPGQPRDPESRKFVLDFEGDELASLPPDAEVEPEVDAIGGEVTRAIARKNDVTGGWRVFFDLKPSQDAPVELRCRLRRGRRPLSETWTFQAPP